jgi:sugar O-acyltransferase (sialic acid O-acetyltransferase NeuD family)
MQQLILIGGGGHCISCIDVLRANNCFEICGILDAPEKVGELIAGIRIIGTDSDIPEMANKYGNFLITLGQIKSCETRFRIFSEVKKYGGNLPVIISPEAYVSPDAFIDEGSIIMHHALVNADASIGKICIINSGALVEHEAIIGDFCHVSTHAVVNGQVVIGRKSFIGSNSVIANNLIIPDESIVSAGACLLKAPVGKGTFIGNPARKNN